MKCCTNTLLSLSLLPLLTTGCIEVKQSANDVSDVDVSNHDVAGNDVTTPDIGPDTTADIGPDGTMPGDTAPDVVEPEVVEDPIRVTITSGKNQRYFVGNRLADGFSISVSDATAVGGGDFEGQLVHAFFRTAPPSGRPGPDWESFGHCLLGADNTCVSRFDRPLIETAYQFRFVLDDTDPDGVHRADTVATARTIRKLVTSAHHSCVLTEDRSLHCWGYNGENVPPDSPYAVHPMTDAVPGGLVLTGTEVPTPGLVGDVALGGNHHEYPMVSGAEIAVPMPVTCITAAGGSGNSPGTWCVGAGVVGQRGDGSVDATSKWGRVKRFETLQNAPMPPSFGLGFQGLFGCGLFEISGILNAWCWGDNRQRQLGSTLSDGQTHGLLAVATPLGGLATDVAWDRVDVGWGNACVSGMTTSNPSSTRRKAWCWGANADGQVAGDFATMPKHFNPVAFPMTLGASFAIPCNNLNPQLASLIQDVNAVLDVDSIAVGAHHLCGIARFGSASTLVHQDVANACGTNLDDSFVFCTGSNSSGQRGGGRTDPSRPNWLISGDGTGTPDTNYRKLAAGEDFTCGLKLNGNIFCWGSNSSGQLAMAPDKELRTYPEFIALPAHLVASGVIGKHIAAGPEHVCAVIGPPGEASPRDRVYCWGNNAFGQSGPSCSDPDNMIQPGHHLCAITTPTPVPFH